MQNAFTSQPHHHANSPISQWDDITPAEIIEQVSGALTTYFASLGGYGGMAVMRFPSKTVADSSILFKVYDQHQRPVAVLHCCQKTSPGLVARGVKNARYATDMVGENLGNHIMKPLITGEVDGRSYAVSSWMRSLSNSKIGWRVQREFIRPPVLSWVRGMAIATRREATASEVEANFSTPLNFLVDNEKLTPLVRSLASEALEKMTQATWKPVHMLDHNDLWKGNILLPFDWIPYSEFQIIDWGAANKDGYGVHDLLVVAASLNTSDNVLKRELNKLAVALHWEPAMLSYQFMASMGHLGLNREHFPEDRYLYKVERTVELLTRILV